MKKIDIPLIILFLLLLLSGCKKEEISLTIIEGHVLEFGTNKPIADARVLLKLGTSSNSLTGEPSIIEVDTAITNEDGSYYLSFWAQDYPVRDLFVEHDDYFDMDPAVGIIAHANNEQDIIMDPHAWLKIHVKNVNPVNDSDNIRYNGNWGGAGPQDNPGIAVDFFDTKEVRGNQDVRLTWTVTKDGIAQIFRDTIYCPAHEIYEYEIHY